MKHDATQRDNTGGFELFEPDAHDNLPKGRPGAWLPQVRLEKSAVWTISRPALELLGNPEAVTLWYDPQRGRVGFRAAKKGEPAAYPVRSPGSRSSQGLVSGRKFCSHHGIPHEESKTYPASMEEGLLVITVRD